MKRIVLVTLGVLLMSNIFAQQSADVGIWGGTGTYFGDMTKIDLQSSLKPAYGAYLRYNFNPRYGVRLGLITGQIGAEGEYEGRSMLFEKRVTDVDILGEFNFFRYIMGKKKNSITTYLLGGFGVSMFKYDYAPNFLRNEVHLGYLNDPIVLNDFPELLDEDSYDKDIMGLHATLGFGFKFNIGERWGVGAEAQLKKYFNDKLDELDDPRKSYSVDINGNGMWTNYTDTWHNNDWTVYLGVHVTYKFYLGKNECPVYENLN